MNSAAMWLLIVSFLEVLGLAVYYLVNWYRNPYIDGYKLKTVFITGTDSGFGFELAVNLARCGVTVYAGCYTEEGKTALQKATNDGVTTILIDITNEKSVVRAKEIVEKDLQENGKTLWGIVNNAVVSCGYTFPLAIPDDYRNTMEVNFFGTISVTETFLPLIKKSFGRIVNVSRISGRSSGGVEPYSCSMHALESYNNGLRRCMRNYEIHVAIIEAGMLKSTNLCNNSTFEDSIDKAIMRLPENLKEEYGENVRKIMKHEMKQVVRSTPVGQSNRNSMVISKIKHALFAQHPKARYV